VLRTTARSFRLCPRFDGRCIAGALVLALITGWYLAAGTPANDAQAAPRAVNRKPSTPPAPPPVVRKVAIARVNVNEREKVLASAARIDKLVEANYKKYNIQPNPLTTDEQFVRRVYLEITGTIPTLRQVRGFVFSKDPEKRARLIDTLLNSPGYASNFYNYWGDILRLSDRVTNNIPGKPYQEWVKECLETNKPYDQFVYEMLTAEGKYFDNPATGYIVRDSGMPLDSLNNTVRIFLGTQIGCAQCHDHPFDKWTQREFYEMAAYTFGTRTRRAANDKSFGGKNVVTALREDLKKIDEKFDGGGKYNRFLFGNLVEVADNGAKLRFPHDYQYDDAKPNEVVVPQTLFDPPIVLKPGESPRVAFARWLTSPENPRFAMNIANRLWKKCFGVGQIEPIDDIRDESIPENPELMKFLTSEMIRVKFDMKEYLRIILNTKTYQREASREEFSPAETYHFPGPVLRRMTPEQVWDSFVTLAVFDPDKFPAEPAVVQSSILNVDLAQATAEELMKRDEVLREVTNYKNRNVREKDYRYKGMLLVRASELPVPAPASHFLRQFGQSDHESIETSSLEGSVPQVLQMFNGPITHMLLEPKSLMVTNVAAEKTIDGGIDVVFWSILSRRPSDEERNIAREEIQANGPAGFGNVVWALVNTRQFLFIQ